MRDLGQLAYCLGIEFKITKNAISISQKKYIEEVLKKFDMTKCKPVNSPMEVGLTLQKSEGTDKEYPFQKLIGCLMYLAVATRPDISHAVSYLSQFNQFYGKEHWLAAKRVLRYLQGTKNHALTYRKTKEPLYGLADANWATCTMDRRSYTGFCFIFAGAAISWESRKQRTVALSTAEAEYMALTDASKEAMYLKGLSNDVGDSLSTVQIFSDNQAAQHLAINPVVSSKNKHISIREHFIREAVQRRDVRVEYLKSEEMTADIFTKGLPGPRLSQLRQKLGLEPCS